MRASFAVPSALVLALLLLVPSAVADHPGSNLGLARFVGVAALTQTPVENLVHNVQTVDMTLEQWQTDHPEWVDRIDIGETSSGQPLYGLRLTDESVAYDDAAALGLSTGHKLRVYLDGGHHGNEYLGVELLMYYLEDLLNKAADGDEPTTAFLRTHEVYALPIVNVDGNSADTRKNSRQVDVNRNYDFQFGGPGSGDSITDLNYRGPSAFSEAEVRANAEFAGALSPDLWITTHTGVAEFYWPWGWTLDAAPDQVFFESLEAPFENATNGRVDAMQAAALYEAAGATDDYGYAVVGTPTFTYEVHEDQFIPVYGEPINTVIADQLAGLDFMVRNTKNLGAWVEVHPRGDGWVAHNFGWGVATNVTLTTAGQTHLLEAIAPGEMVPLDFDVAPDATWEYPALLIESSRVRHHALPESVGTAATDAGANSVPAPSPLALLALVGVAALVLARRRAA